jgi:hypothetical protein
MNGQPESSHDAEHNPAAQEFLRNAYSHADSIYAVPQPEAWSFQIDGESSSKRFLKYQYQPLQSTTQVRLIRLTHASNSKVKIGGNSMPDCEVFLADVNDSPQYETISYAWGPLHDTMPIFIDGDFCLEITKNLWSAIDVFRYISQPVILWADQVCIDQHNLQERRRQVALMQRIYSQARHTIIWLGSVDSVAARAFEFIEKVSELSIDQPTTWKIGLRIAQFGEEVVLAQHPVIRDFIVRERLGLRALSQLLRRPWFSRMWCFQEVVMSRSLLYFCGPSCCSWRDLYKAVGFCCEEPLPPIGWSSTGEALKSREQHLAGRADNMLELLRRTSYCLSTDPRDKIYAVLNVQSRHNAINLTADYTRTIKDVYVDTTTQVINQTRSLSIFMLRRENAKSEIPGLPTFVPDFSATGTPVPVEHPGRSSFRASANRPYISYGPQIQGQLNVRGKLVDRLVGLVFGSLHTNLNDDAFAIDKLYPTMLEILRGRMGVGKQHNARINPVAEKLIRTLTADLGGTWDRQDVTSVDYVQIRSIIDALRLPRSNQGVLSPWLQRFRSEARRCNPRSCLSLEKNTIALGPKSARPGDVIAILNGSSTPLVLRQKGHYFELIGQCYVDGMMYGEICTWPDEQADTFFLI